MKLPIETRPPVTVASDSFTHSPAQQCGLVNAINSNVRLLQNYFPYHESDHVLNIADNAMAWSLKAWLALSVSETGRWKIRRREEKFCLLRMEFRTFVTAMIRIPCQIVRTSRRTFYRLLNGNKRQPVFWRLVESLRL